MFFYGDNLREDQIARRRRRVGPAPVNPPRVISPPHEKGLCWFIDNQTQDWIEATYCFVRGNELELIYANEMGRFVTKVVDYSRYEMERPHVGSTSDWKEWSPSEKNIGSSISLTLTMFPNRTDDEPDLWIQFPKVDDFLNFFGYWLKNIRTVATPRNDMDVRDSIAYYRGLKRTGDQSNIYPCDDDYLLLYLISR